MPNAAPLSDFFNLMLESIVGAAELNRSSIIFLSQAFSKLDKEAKRQTKLTLFKALIHARPIVWRRSLNDDNIRCGVPWSV